MAVLKKKIKIALGLVAVSVLFVGTVLGILYRENNPKNNQKQVANQEKKDYYLENQEIQETKLVCSQLLEETLEKNENTLVFEEYTNIEPVECLFVGCGGFF